MKYWGNIQETLGLKADDIDVCDEIIWQTEFMVDRESFKIDSKHQHSEINVYTDGSKMSNNIGAAYVIYRGKQIIGEASFKLPSTCTVFQAEVKAILEASKFLTQKPEFKYIKFFIDSQAAILAVENTKINSTLVRDAKKELNTAAKGRRVVLCWTKAHIGTEGNERADVAAKQGGETGIQSMVSVPKAELKAKIEEYYYEIWGTAWSEYKGARMAKQFYSKPDSNQAKYVLKLGRLELSRFLRLVSGHNGLFYFKSKIDGDINAVCRFCLEADETFHHLMTECPAFNVSRREIFLTDVINTQNKWSVRDILNFSYLPGVREAVSYTHLTLPTIYSV